MTASAFGRLLYTDCRAGTGRGAGGGFQVQAQSAGVDSAQSRMAVSWLLYEAQNTYIVQRRPVEEFPPGFAHACDEGYGTAQSRYVGKEATGGRQGNHLTDCLLTRDPDLYGSTRPAQLWRSDLWQSEPWDTQDCPQFTDDLPLGPLTVDAVADWLRDAKERGPVLAKLLSVLEDPAGKRVVIVAADADEALSWVAAATLLLPVRLALDVSFKVFSSNPLRAEQRIVAVPKELNAQLTPGRPDSVLILDAGECAIDDVETTRRASFLVDQLLSVDEPYDVVDAVELAESLAGGQRSSAPDALFAAWALTRPSDPLVDPLALGRWLYQAGPQLRRDYGPPLAGLILQAGPSAGLLRWLDQCLADQAMDFDAAPVRTQLFGAELAEARDGHAPPGDLLAEVELGYDARRDAESELSSAILLGSDAQVDLLLRLARRHRVIPELAAAPMQRRLEEFVADWIDRGPAYEPGLWARREEVLDIAQGALRVRLQAGGLTAVRAALGRMFRYFADRAGDPSDPLDRHLAAAAIADRPSRDRPAELRALLDRLTFSPSYDASAAGLQQALVEWDAVGPAEADLIITGLREDITILPEIVRVATIRLEQTAAKPSEHTLKVLASLDRRGIVPPPGPLADLLVADRDVLAFIDATSTNDFVVDQRYFRGTVARLGRAAPAVVVLRLASVLRACLECRHPDVGGEVLSVLEARKLRPSPARLLLDLWQQELGRPDTIHATIWGVRCLDYPELPAKRRDQIVGAIRDFRAELSRADQQRWFQEVHRYLDPALREIWAEVAGADAAKPRLNLWINRDGGRS
jgi:hypothetical protein